MDTLVWIFIATGILLLIVGLRVALTFKKLSKEERQKAINYRVFLTIGKIAIPVGLLFLLLAIMLDYKLWPWIIFIIIGLVYLIIGSIIKNKRDQQT